MNKARRKNIERAADLIRECVDKLSEAKGIIDDAATEEREYYDNMSDNLKGGDKGTRAEEDAERLEEVQNAMDEFDADELVGKLMECLD
jgi:hypothetical protein